MSNSCWLGKQDHWEQRRGRSAVVTCYIAGVDLEWPLTKVIITFIFCCDNLWKSKWLWKSLENSGNFFLLLCGHPVVAVVVCYIPVTVAVAIGVVTSSPNESLHVLWYLSTFVCYYLWLTQNIARVKLPLSVACSHVTVTSSSPVADPGRGQSGHGPPSSQTVWP